jgi:archaellum component FlaC
MDNNQSNSHKAPEKEIIGSDSAAQKTEPLSHFKRELVPLDEYAARQGISSDIVEQQGQLGVIQIRKFKGQKFVVDVPADQLSEFEADQVAENAAIPVRPCSTTASKLFTAGLIAGVIVIVVSVFWLYMDAKTRLDDLNADYMILQNKYNDLTASNQNVKAMQDQLAGSKVEFARIQNRIALSKTDLERIQADLNKSRQNLETIQSELSGVQGQISLSKIEIESIQNGLNESRKKSDSLNRQNAESGTR